MSDVKLRSKTGPIEDRLQAIEALDGTRSPDERMRLIETLSDPRWVVRRRACERVAHCGEEAIDPLEALLAEGTDDQKYWAVRALVGIGPAAVPALVRALTGGGTEMRIYAAGALGDVGQRSAIPHLIAGLADPVWRVRKACFEALVEFGPRALGLLREAIGSDNEDTVYWSARALGRLGELSRATLIDALRRGSSQLKFILAAALGESGDERVVSLLIHNLRGGPWILQKRSADALAEIGPRAAAPMAVALVRAHPPQDYWLILALARLGEPGIERLAHVFTQGGESFRWDKRPTLAQIGEPLYRLLARLHASGDRDVRLFAVTCLGDLKSSREADDLLLAALADAAWSIRKAAADCLVERGPLLLDRLRLALETDNDDVRYWVTHIFRKMGDLGVACLVRALGDANKGIAFFAAEALGEVRSREVVRPLTSALADSSWHVRRVGAESLTKLGDLAVAELILRLNDDDEHVLYWVAKALKRIGEKGVPELLRILQKGSDEERYLAAKALGLVRAPQAREGLRSALADGHEWVRLYSAVALAELDDLAAVEHLVACLGDPAFKLHPSVLSVFEHFGSRATPLLLSALDGAGAPRTAHVLRVLGHLADPAAYETILPYLQHPSDPVKVAAVEALAAYPADPRTTTILTGLLATCSDRVRGRVLAALGEAGGDEGIRQMVATATLASDDRERRQVEQAVVRNSGRAIPVLIQMLSSDKVPLRRAAADLLVRIGAPARTELERVLGCGDKNQRYWANRVLRELSAPRGAADQGDRSP